MRPMRTLLAAVVMVAVPAWAQISGSLTGMFEGFNEFGVSRTRVSLSLQCGLTCDAAAPELTYRVTGDSGAWFTNKTDEKVAGFSAFFGSDPAGNNTLVSEALGAGVATTIIVKDASCHCGNRIGEGGFITLTSATVLIPPWISGDDMRAGYEDAVVISAQPRGNETVTVQLSGAGLDETRTLSVADLANDAAFVSFTPISPGTLTVTATLQPWGAPHTASFEVKPNSSSGSGGGSGSSGLGGGSGGGGDDAPQGCSTGLGLLSVLPLAFLARRRG